MSKDVRDSSLKMHSKSLENSISSWLKRRNCVAPVLELRVYHHGQERTD